MYIITISDKRVKECDYHYKYTESIALVELVSHIEDSGESTLTPELEFSTLYDMYRTRVHQIKSNSIHCGNSSDKCDSHYMRTRQPQHTGKATDYNKNKMAKTGTSNTLFHLKQRGKVLLFTIRYMVVFIKTIVNKVNYISPCHQE